MFFANVLLQVSRLSSKLLFGCLLLAFKDSMYAIGRCSLGQGCKFPTGEIRPKYKCKVCGAQLHPAAMGCSAASGEDGSVVCVGGCNTHDERRRDIIQPTIQVASPEVQVAPPVVQVLNQSPYTRVKGEEGRKEVELIFK